MKSYVHWPSSAQRSNTGSARIVRILSVVDTREYEEVGDDRWAPIPGSGNAHECARCGRLHEVHATVELDDGSTAVVGTGCMDSPAMEAAARRGSTSAKTVARLRAQLAGAERRLVAARTIVAEVHAMAPPPVVFRIGPIPRHPDIEELDAIVGDVAAGRWLRFEPDSAKLRAELAESAIRDWRRARMKDAGVGVPLYQYEEVVKDIKRRLQRAEVRSLNS